MKKIGNDIVFTNGVTAEFHWLHRTLMAGVALLMVIVSLSAQWASATVVIQSQTGSLSKSSGQNAYIDVVAVGRGTLYYQWYKDGNTISGANKNFFWKGGVTVADAGYYLLKIKDLDGTVQSKSILLKVDGESSPSSSTATSSVSSATSTSMSSAPSSGSIVISSLSSDLSKSSGQSIYISVKATGSGTLTYQWFKDGVNLSGATKNAFWKGSAVKADAGYYTVKITDSNGAVVSKPIALSVDGYLPSSSLSSTSLGSTTTSTGSIVISSLSSDLSKSSGQSIYISVKATGSGTLTYQWFKDGVNLSGATKSAFWKGSALKSDAGYYTVKITDSKGAVVSKPIAVKIDGYLPSTSAPSTSSSSISSSSSSATITWAHPGKREDGSYLPISAVAKYRVYHSLPNNTGSKVYEVSGGNYQLTLSSLISGVHYFSVQAIDSSGLESDLSGLVSKKIQ